MRLRIHLLAAVLAAGLLPLAAGLAVTLLLLPAPAMFTGRPLAVLLLACALGAAGLAWWVHRLLNRSLVPLAQIAAQATAAGEGEFQSLRQPDVAEWVPLAREVNIMVARLAQAQAMREAELSSLQSQVDADPTTGLASRARFMADLGAQLSGRAGEGGRQGAVVLVRVNDLVGVNQRQGRERGDDLLRAVATLLRLRVVRLSGPPVQLARLNGADFAVRVPEVDMTLLTDWVADLSAGLRQLQQEGVADLADVAWVGAAAFFVGENLPVVMSRADSMVQACETARQPYQLAAASQPMHAISVMQWRAYIEQALDTGLVRLALQPVLAADGRLLHHEGQVCMGLPNGTELAAAQVLPPAERSGRIIDLDLRALELGLAALAEGRSRVAVRVSPLSIGRPLFLQRLAILLADAPEAAARLVLEVHEGVLEGRTSDLRALAAQVKCHGTRVGLLAVNRGLVSALVLGGAVLDTLKLDASLCDGAGQGQGGQSFHAQALALARAAGCQLIVTGVTDARRLPQFWADGFSGASGPAVAEPSTQAPVAA